MIFKPKPSTIIYLRRQDITLATQQASFKVDLPQDIIYNLEVMDKDKLKTLILKLLVDHNIRGQQAILVLDDSVVFQKSLGADQNIDLRVAFADFESKIPFEADKREVLMVRMDSSITLFGTNKELREQIASSLEKTGNKMIAAVPAAVYGIYETTEFDQDEVANILSSTEPIRLANFVQIR